MHAVNAQGHYYQMKRKMQAWTDKEAVLSLRVLLPLQQHIHRQQARQLTSSLYLTEVTAVAAKQLIGRSRPLAF
eukprot:1157817-Pelagomonas_calceolata.AAC.16